MKQSLLIYSNDQILTDLENYYYVTRIFDQSIDYIFDTIIINDITNYLTYNKILGTEICIIAPNQLNVLNLRTIQITDNISHILNLLDFYKKTIRVKFLCNWTSAVDLMSTLKRFCKNENLWNNIEIVTDNADYYCIINYPNNTDYYDPHKTIILNMEELTNKKTFFPTDWLFPDKHKYLYYFDTHNTIEWHLNKNFNQLMTEQHIKTKLLSTITSSEYRLEGHIKRIDFLKYLDNHIKFDMYGRSNKFNIKNYIGSLPYLQKDDGLFPYKYTIACENNYVDDYFTEKIVDAILSETLCFYWGCPNLEKFIDSRAFIRINIDDHEEAFRIIKKSMRENEFEKRRFILQREKIKILNELQIMSTVEKIIYNSLQQNLDNNDLTEYLEYREKYLPFHGDYYLIKLIDYIFDTCKIKQYLECGCYRGANIIYLSKYDIYQYYHEHNELNLLKIQNNIKNIQNVINCSTIDDLLNNCDIDDPFFVYIDVNDNEIINKLKIITKHAKKYFIMIDDFKNEFNNKFYFNYGNTIQDIHFDNTNIYFSNYNKKTSIYHALVGWVLFTDQQLDCNLLNLKQYDLPNDSEIHILNLKRRFDRLTKIELQINNQFKYNIFEAIDGLTLSLTSQIENIFKIPDNFVGKRWNITHEWKNGIIGCALSHINLWKKVVETKKTFIILEDDVILAKTFKTDIIKLLEQIKQLSCDICYLGLNDSNKQTHIENGDYYINKNLIKFSKIMRKHGGGTYGYIITCEGAIKLLNKITNNGIQQPIDHFMIDMFDELDAYIISDHIVTTQIYYNNSHDTDIQNNSLKLK